MKYIDKIKVDKISILKDIHKNKININELILFLSDKEIQLFAHSESEIKKFLLFLSELKTIKNIERIKKDIYEIIADFFVNDAIKNNTMNSYRESIINKSLKQTLRYSEHLEKPMINSEEVFFNKKNLDTIYNEKHDFFFFNKVELMFDFIMKVLVPYYKKNSTDYKEIIKNKIDDFLDVILSSIEWNSINEFLKIFYSDILNHKRVISLLLTSPQCYYFLNNLLFLELKKQYSDKKKIYDLIITPKEKYNYIYKYLIKEGHPGYLVKLAKFLNNRLPSEAEVIIMSSEGLASDYIKLIKKFTSDEIIMKTPGQVYREVLNLKLGKRPDSEIENFILGGESYILLSYFKKILKSKWIGNEDIKEKIEDGISKNVTSSHQYFFELINKIPKKNNNPQYISQYIENNISPKIITSLLDSNFPHVLYKYAELSRKKLPSEKEEVLMQYPIYWTKYYELFF